MGMNQEEIRAKNKQKTPKKLPTIPLPTKTSLPIFCMILPVRFSHKKVNI